MTPLGAECWTGAAFTRGTAGALTTITRAAAVMIIAHAPVEPGSLVAQLVKNLPTMQETLVQSLGQEDPMEGNSNLLEYSGLENSMDCIVHGITKSQTELSDFHFILNYFIGMIEIQLKIIKGSYQQMF